MKTLDRYILKIFFSNYLLAMFVLICLYVILDLFVNFDEFTEAGKPLHIVLYNIFDYYIYNVPLYFSQLSGVIVLFAGCGTFVRLQRRNEMTAALASGTSLYRLAAPVIVGALVVNALLIVDNEFILPSVAPKLARNRDDVEGARVYDVWCVKVGESQLLSALKFSPKQEKIRGLIVIEQSADPQSKGRIRSVITADEAQWDAEKKGWDLVSRGSRITMLSQDAAGNIGRDLKPPEPVKFYPCSLTPEELLLRQQRQWISYLSLAQLEELLSRGDMDPVRITQVKHGRYTLPVGNMILLLLGITFFLNRLPGGVLTQAAKALAMTAVAFIVSFIGQQFVGTTELPAALTALPAWLPIFLFGPIAVVLLDNIKT